jgi:hypothetical protein
VTELLLKGRERGAMLAFVALAPALLALYGWVAFGLPGDANVLPHSSGIYDMDVKRVMVDLTTSQPGHRASAHPLQKLLLAPWGQALTRLTGDPLSAAKTLALLATWLGALAAGALARSLSDGAWPPALATTALTGCSFAYLLAAGIPESATFAGLATPVALLFWLARRGRAFATGEALSWGALAALAFGLTFTQVAGVAIAFAARLWDRHSGGMAARALWQHAGIALLSAASLAVALAEVQAHVYPGTPRFWTRSPVAAEKSFVRSAAIQGMPVAHTGRLLLHFGVIDFVAPMPVLSDFLLRDHGIPTWSLSLEEAGWEEWRPAQRGLAAALVAAIAAALGVGRWRDPRMLVPALCLAFHFALHWLYGREYVIYAPHWHGLLIATLLAGVWNGGHLRRGVAIASGLLAIALLANNLVVLRASYAEVAWGLGTDRRDLRGDRVPPPSEPGSYSR